MRVTITFRNAQTKRNNTVKDVLYLGGQHARLITEAVPGTINYPLPNGFIIKHTAGGRPHIRSIDLRTKEGKKLKTGLRIGVAELRKGKAKKKMDTLRTKRAAKELYFRINVKAYAVSGPDVVHRRAEVVDWRGSQYVSFHSDEEIVAPMSSLDDLGALCEETIFNGKEAGVITSDFEDDFYAFLDEHPNAYNTRLKSWILKVKESNEMPLLVFFHDDPKTQLDIPRPPDIKPSFIGDPAQLPVGDGTPLLASRLLHYDITPSTTFKGMFNVPVIQGGPDNQCLANSLYIMCERDTVFQGNNGKKIMKAMRAMGHLRFFWTINHPNTPYPGDDNLPMATLEEYYPVFDMLMRDLRIFDIRSRLWKVRHPYKTKFSYAAGSVSMNYLRDRNGDMIETRPDNNSGNKVISFIIHNKHVYFIDRPYVATAYEEEAVENYHNVSTMPTGTVEYDLPKEKKEEPPDEKDCDEKKYRPAPAMVLTHDVGAPWWDALAETVSMDEEQHTHYTFYLAEPLFQAGISLFQEEAYEAAFVASNSETCAGLNIPNLYRDDQVLTIKIRSFPEQLIKYVDPDGPDAERILQSFLEEEHALKCRILTQSVRSQYSDETRLFFEHHKAGGERGTFLNDEEWAALPENFVALGLDFAKFFPSIMCSFDHLPVTAIFDDPLPYDGHVFEDYTIYHVEPKFPERFYARRTSHTSYGLTLKERYGPQDWEQHFRVICFVRPARLAPNHYRAEVESLVQRSDLHPGIQKTLLAKMYGLCAISAYKRFGSKIFFDLTEAEHHKALMPEAQTMVKNIEGFDGYVYALLANRQNDLHSGFLPISLGIIDRVFHLTNLLERRMRSLGYQVIGKHCDNVYVNVPYDSWEHKARIRSELGNQMCDLMRREDDGSWVIDDEADHGCWEAEAVYSEMDKHDGMYKFNSSTFENFGRLKFEAKVLPEKKPKTLQYLENHYSHPGADDVVESVPPKTVVKSFSVRGMSQDEAFQAFDEMRAAGRLPVDVDMTDENNLALAEYYLKRTNQEELYAFYDRLYHFNRHMAVFKVVNIWPYWTTRNERPEYQPPEVMARVVDMDVDIVDDEEEEEEEVIDGAPRYLAPTTYTVDEWDEEAMFQIFDGLRAQGVSLQMLAKYPGCGKTTILIRYCIARGLKVVALSYQNRKVCEMIQDFGDYEGVRASTIDYLFESEGSSDAFAWADVVLIDEWATTPVPSATKIKRKMSAIKWLCLTSDVNQNPAINKEYNNIGDVQAYYTAFTDRMCPAKIVLEQPKRCRCPHHLVNYDLPTIRDCHGCGERRHVWAWLCDAILNAPTNKDAREVVLNYFRKISDLRHAPLTNNITYYQCTRDQLNSYGHLRTLERKGLHAHTRYYEGQSLICRVRYRTKKVSLYTNYDVEVIAIDGKQLTLLEPLTKTEFPMTMEDADKFLDYYHAVTCHSKQGSSVTTPVCVFNIFSKYVTRNWLLVAVTRHVDFSQTSIFIGDLRDHEDTMTLKHYIKDKIDAHRNADKAAGRPFKNHQYITIDYIMDLLYTTSTCAVCGTDRIRAFCFSIDRIDSELAHLKGNVQILCSSSCNASKKQKYLSS